MAQQQHLAAADSIRARHDEQITRIRNRNELTPEAKIGLMARVHADAKEQMTKLQQTAQESTAAKRSTLERSAFGIADLPGDPATNATSFRDAQDRVAQIDTPDAAATMLARAERSGDEPLARAVAGHAYDQASSGLGQMGSGWDDVLNSYLQGRPGKADNVQQLHGLRTNLRDVRSLFAFVLPEPSEIGHVPPGMLQQYADAADGI